MSDEVIIDSTDEVPTTSRKREITASILAVAVTVALGIAANVAIEKVSDRVKNKIAPKKTETE